MVRLNPPKRRKKEKFIEYDIHEINAAIYNDQPLNIYEDDRTEWFVDQILEKGETAKKLDTSTLCHFITNYGRVINAKQMRVLTIQNIRDYVHAVYLDANRRRLHELMEEVGYIYDFKTIQDRYEKNNWNTRWVKG
jgi:hypothetical protein